MFISPAGFILTHSQPLFTPQFLKESSIEWKRDVRFLLYLSKMILKIACKQILLVALIPVVIINSQAPCSNYWQYVRGSDKIEGLLTLMLNSGYSEHNVKLILSVGAKLPNVSFINN